MRTIFRAALISSVAIFITWSQALAVELWHIKCFNARGQTLAIKAFSAEGMTFDVKAIEVENTELLDVKMVHPDTGKTMPVKVLASSDDGASYSDVKAIMNGNQVLPVKAITDNGKVLGVKAFYNDDSGQYDIKCLGSGGHPLGLKAISPKGRVFDVKGIKDLPGQEELQVEVQAHIKAKPQG